MYENLKSLFGSEDLVPLGTIIISSDGPARVDPNSAAAPYVILDSDNEEITSPDVLGRKPPVRRFFMMLNLLRH